MTITLFTHKCQRVKIINITAFETTATSSNAELTCRKAIATDETGNTPIIFYRSLTSAPKEGSIYEITHILISSFNYKRFLKTTSRATVDLCDGKEVTIIDSEDILTSVRQESRFYCLFIHYNYVIT